ncbi:MULTISPECIES: hypothetical protein [unclassified Streptomyces]|uniref:hypothetical protein n=1 Tax=unclassified Streptomyces TaxID=2593676 RepID=UPI00081EC7B2|nr:MULTISPECIES: hypothetical protein [unclassified Streptomyces]MYZ39902.1 hypothetical protein [Streptomyces sp. SID4917]SCG05731.1 hypothetical protein GA0115259_109764 [Streptomyces sp. MnatMP-M17]
MIREERLVISRKPHAVDLGSLRVEERNRADGTHYYGGRINALWFRRRAGLTVACIGTLWDFQHERPVGAAEFLAAHNDGRYGPDCEGRWDGTSYWGNVTLAVQKQHLAVLQPMLENYPNLPAGYDGWWTFATART